MWIEAQSSAPLQMAQLLSDLRERNWAPSEKLEREWFDELNNLYAPLNLNAFKKSGIDLLSKLMHEEQEHSLHEDVNLLPILTPEHSGAEFSMHTLDDGRIATHAPASAGLIQVWTLPQCVETLKHKLYSRRSACAVSGDGLFVASKTETGKLAIDRLEDARTLKTWTHPNEFNGGTYMIEKYLNNNELLLSDSNNSVHFLSINMRVPRTYANLLVRNKSLIDCSNDGSMLITPEYGKRPYTIWKFTNTFSKTDEGIRPNSDMEKLLSLGSESLPNMRAKFSPNGKFLAISTPIEIQVRKFPFEEVVFQSELGRDIEQPLLAFDSDSQTLAVLRRSNPAELIFINLNQLQISKRLKLASIFSRSPLTQIEFMSDSKTLLLAGKERIYACKQNDTHDATALLNRLVNLRIKDIQLEDLQSLESLQNSGWLSMYLRPWVETLLYLLKRRTYDIAISEPDKTQSRYDIEIAES